MSPLERLLVDFCRRPTLEICAIPVLGLAGLAWWPLALLVLLVPLAHWRGTSIIRHYLPSLEEDLQEQLTETNLLACGIHSGEHHFILTERSGSIDIRLVRDLPDTFRLTVLAPKRDYVVMSTREGRLFPPLETLPPTFDTTDLGCVEIYYSDIDMVELENGTLRFHTMGGRELEFPARQGAALEAAQYLRQRLRDYKARVNDGLPA